ncbi:MAG: DUF4270 family protein [Bacteroidales bacterium]|nr:DUF4270 family protein [Bacteroidales bacterium]
MKNFIKGMLTLAVAVALTGFVACTDEESALGIDLVDSTMLYSGITDTLAVDEAWTEPEDSLLTSNYSFGIIGNYSDATFGKVSSVLYTQIGLPLNSSDISFDGDWEMDSVVLSLTRSQVFPDTNLDYSFHFEVKQLSEPLLNDTAYYAFSSLPVDESTLFFDDNVSVGRNDTVINMKLDPSFYPVIQRQATADEFREQTKGLRIRITQAGDDGMLSVDFSSGTTCLRAYYHYVYQGDTTKAQYTFLMGAGTSHFTQFIHDYSGTIFAGRDRLPGNLRLYLEPMGGRQVRVNFNSALQRFHQLHPWAVIHHAELILPVAPECDDAKPDKILALEKRSDGTEAYIDDLVDIYTLSGYDGTYHADGNYFRIRMTQHVQGLLRQGYDPGTLLILNSRRNAAQRLILNGTSVEDSPRLVFVYTE